MKNMGSIDKTLRLLVGAALVAFAFLSQSPYHWFGLLGFVLIATALISWCPIYRIFGVQTCAVPKR